MADSPYTGVEHIEPNQNQKEVTANNGFDRLSLFIAETLSLTITGDTLLTEVQAQEAVRFDLGGTPSSGFLLELPSTVKKFFIVENGSGQTADVQVVGAPGSTVSLADGNGGLFYTDGTNVTLLSSTGAVSIASASDTDLTTNTPVNGDALVTLGTSNWVPVKLKTWSVLDKDVSDPSTLTPSEEDAYIVGNSAVGVWSGQDGNVAYYFGGSWQFITATEGMLAWVADEEILYARDASSWVAQQGVTQFINLLDTPASYTAKKLLRVNTGGTALEFVDDPLTVAFYAGGTYTALQLLMKYVTDRSYTLPSGLTGSQAHLTTAPAGSISFDIRKNGSSIGSIDFAGGADTGTFTFSSAVSFAAGDRLEVVAPDPADGSASDLGVSLKGNKD